MTRGPRARAARSPLLVAGVLGIAAAVVTSACGRSAGAKCKGFESTCLDKQTALACHDDRFVAVPCGGPLGCTKSEGRAICDDSIAALGAPCMAAGDTEYACTADRKTALACVDRRFARYLECRGRGGCTLSQQQIACDTTAGAPGDPCRSEGSVACTEDGRAMLLCHGNELAPYRFCRGQYGCSLQGNRPTCDETLAVEGDPCGLPGHVVCSVDGQSELLCQGGAFVHSRFCKRSGCVVSNRPGRPIDCD